MYNEPEPPYELLACFDEEGNSIESHTRQEAHHEPLKYWHAVVNVWLIDKAGRMLCSLRSKTLTGNPNKWQTYFGGHVKAGRTFKEAAITELEEEIGLNIDPAKLVFIKSGKWDPSKHFFKSYIYPFVSPIETLRFSDGEIVEVSWFSFDEYNLDRKNNPDKWCNGCSLENQRLIKGCLNFKSR
jgi:8-oxo-dGTP pyrophosphatase MutT (NUDIX family)